MRKKKVIIILLASFLFTLSIIGFVAKKVIISLAKDNISWAENMNINGPWSEKAIWKSSDGYFYLICEQYNETENITVSSYIKMDAEWIKCSVNYRSGVNHFYFDTDDGQTLLECEANLENDMLVLTDLESYSPSISGLDSITLSKHDYNDTIASLPFLI